MFIQISNSGEDRRFLNISNFDLVKLAVENGNPVAVLTRTDNSSKVLVLKGQDAKIIEDHLMDPPSFWKNR